MELPVVLSFFFFILSTVQVFPPESHPLRVRYPMTQYITPGDTILKSYTQELPIISARGLNPDLTYLLLFYDLDVIYGETATVALHWYQPNMIAESSTNPTTTTPNDAEDLILTNRTSGAEYIAPRPPPKSHHRYVYLLFHQPDDYKFRSCFSHILPPTADAREGFDVRQFIEVAALDAPVAGTYFYVRFDGPQPTDSTPIAMPTTTSLRSAPCQGSTTAAMTTTAATGAGTGTATAACEYARRAQIVL